MRLRATWPLIVAIGCSATDAKPAASRNDRPASVEGDVYLVMQSGDTKRAAANKVYLVRDTDSLQQLMGGACDTLRSALNAIAKNPSTNPAAPLSKNAALRRVLQDSLRVALEIVNTSKVGDFVVRANDRAERMRVRLQEIDPAEEVAAATERARKLTAAARAETRAKIRSTIAAGVVDTIGTGVNAHYRFAAVPSGRYALFAEWAVGEHPYSWWKPIDVKSGEAMKVDLDNSAEANDRLYCGTK